MSIARSVLLKLSSGCLKTVFIMRIFYCFLLMFFAVEAATKGLFAGLRSLDEHDLDLILVTTTAETGLGQAYMNRLKKAAGQKWYS